MTPTDSFPSSPISNHQPADHPGERAPGSAPVRQDVPMTPWAAPHTDGPVHAKLSLPGSKSLTNRVLVLAALADGASRIVAPLRARDTILMADALRALGVEHRPTTVPTGSSGRARCTARTIDTGLAGTVMRFVPPVAALADGDVSLRRRRVRARAADGHPARRAASGGRRGRRRRRAAAAVHRAWPGRGRRRVRSTSTRRRRRSSCPGLLLSRRALRQGHRGRAHRRVRACRRSRTSR